ncbi:uncharacterized WD repeat-containing protein alr3466-like [Hydractinia symbiolongicarpus]|uniref:uncharacterized WD repeat-containing protein alr3466-like n=1 Tax=Hydractinia symbiolongicarpus TaxID=13093 RepID=UPI00254CBE61|nr:uncharacterized WD repeat-containing protein alr3466-like [Hydractinia symbiolongicarpus]
MPEQNSLLQKYEQDQPHNAKLSGLFIEEQTKLAGHGWNISCLQFSQNGLYLASGSWDKNVFIWDLRTLDAPKVLDGEGEGHTSAVTSLCWLPNIEFLLASASADHSILIWNSDTGDVMARLMQHQSWVLGTTFTADGKILASSSWNGSVILWDMNMLKPANQLVGHSAGVWACSFDNNSAAPILCTASEDTSIRLWDMRTDHNWHSDVLLSGVHADAIKCCCWSPCSNYLAAGSKDAKISIWDVRANKAINCLQGHTAEVSNVEFMSSSSNLIFSVGDTQCCLWNIFNPQGDPVCFLKQHLWSYEVESLALSPDATLLATGSVDKQITLSTIDITEEFYDTLQSDVNTLPYAQMPVKTQSSSSLPSLGNESSASVLDKAKTDNQIKLKEMTKLTAKQTIRIKAPVTSALLQDKRSKLKTVKSHESINDLFQGLKLPTAVDEGSMRFKSKELLAERKKLRPTKSNTQSDVKDTRKYTPLPPPNDATRNSLMSELQSNFLKPRGSVTSEYDINVVADEMIQLSEELQRQSTHL